MPVTEWIPIPPSQQEAEEEKRIPATTTPSIGKKGAKKEKVRKSVRFAEVLEHICIFSVFDPPKLLLAPLSSREVVIPAVLSKRLLNITNLVLQKSIALEKCFVRGEALVGSILVANLAFEKRVFVRSTWNNWKTFEDTDALYINSCANGMMDRFEFKLDFLQHGIEEAIDLAVAFACNSTKYWDSNDDFSNYHFSFMPRPPKIIKKARPPSADEDWNTTIPKTFSFTDAIEAMNPSQNTIFPGVAADNDSDGLRSTAPRPREPAVVVSSSIRTAPIVSAPSSSLSSSSSTSSGSKSSVSSAYSFESSRPGSSATSAIGIPARSSASSTSLAPPSSSSPTHAVLGGGASSVAASMKSLSMGSAIAAPSTSPSSSSLAPSSSRSSRPKVSSSSSSSTGKVPTSLSSASSSIGASSSRQSASVKSSAVREGVPSKTSATNRTTSSSATTTRVTSTSATSAAAASTARAKIPQVDQIAADAAAWRATFSPNIDFNQHHATAQLYEDAFASSLSAMPPMDPFVHTSNSPPNSFYSAPAPTLSTSPLISGSPIYLSYFPSYFSFAAANSASASASTAAAAGSGATAAEVDAPSNYGHNSGRDSSSSPVSTLSS